MKPPKKKLTLYDQTQYRITVNGYLDEHFADGNPEITIHRADSIDCFPVTSITCTTDQAGLIGILRKLYTLGLPLVSVNLFDS